MQYVNDDEGEAEGISPEEFLAAQKKRIRRSGWWSLFGGAALIVINIALVVYVLGNADLVSDYGLQDETLFSLLQRSIFFLIGIFLIAVGLWRIYESRRLTFEDLVPSPEAVEFFRAGEGTSHLYAYLVLLSLVAVFAAQQFSGLTPEGESRSFEMAGLVRERIIGNGEWWRLMTSGVVHANILHIYFNAQAFFGFAGLIELIADRSRMAIVFVISVIGGGLVGLAVSDFPNSVGASGGVMGLIGYVAIYGYRRKRQLPPDFLRSVAVNIVLILGIGIVGYKFINNFAHIGGLTAGAIYGFFTIPRDIAADPRKIGAVTEGAGMIAMGIIVFTAVFTILLVTEQIIF